MDAAQITATVGALAVLGAGAKYLIDRMDRKREKRETAVEELLKAQAAKAERRYARLHATATKWREQLIANDISPQPADWPEDPHE